MVVSCVSQHDDSFAHFLASFCLDFLFHTPQVLDAIRECAGADWRYDHFVFTTDPMKKGEYYGASRKSVINALLLFG